MSRTRVRLQDIANATGYSMNTVSLALRNSPRIGKKTHALIWKEAEKLNYVPNRIARSLASQASNMVGLVMTDIMNPTLTLAARTIERKLSQAGYGMMFAASDSLVENEKNALQWFQSYQVDGILIYPADHGELDHIAAVSKGGIPVIMLANLPEAGLDVVTVDDRIGAARAVGHLISRGHKRIAFVDAGQEIHTGEKADGARRAIAEAGMPEDALVIIHPGGNSPARGYEAMQQVSDLASGITAVFTSTDSLAIGAMRWCQTNGLSVPDEMAIMGYDDTETAAYCSIPLTTVHYAADEVSNLAVERMVEIIKAPDHAGWKPEIKRIEPNVVVRSST